MPTYDVIVAGLGVAGSSAAYHLARTGQRVLALDQFAPPHALGSSHGGSRIIREAYFEDSAYVPLVRRSYDLWQELEQLSGERLLIPTGGVTIGRPNGELVQGARSSATTYGIPHEVLSSREIQRRFPDFRPGDDMVGIFEHRAGVLLPEACVAAQISQARNAGAVVHFDEELLEWHASPTGVSVRTTRAEYSAGTLVLAAGPWLPELLGPMNLGLWVERQVMHWFRSAVPADRNNDRASPITLWEYEPNRMFFTIPDLGEGTKAAFHHEGERVAAKDVRRDIDDAERTAIERIIARHMPGLTPHVVRSATCLYTNTPDEHFIIDAHPEHSNVIVASACSGHGFKFGPVVGEIVAGLVAGRPDARLELFSMRRLMV